MNDTQLTDKEVLFCELYVSGTAPYAGNAVKCYSEVFHVDGINTRHLAKKLLAKQSVKDYIQELDALNQEETNDMKRYLTQNLMQILEETSTAQFRDRRGTILSPAPLRSVAVSAAKLLADMYPVKEAQTTNVNLEGCGECGITFNVIVPEVKTESPTQPNK